MALSPNRGRNRSRTTDSQRRRLEQLGVAKPNLKDFTDGLRSSVSVRLATLGGVGRGGGRMLTPPPSTQAAPSPVVVAAAVGGDKSDDSPTCTIVQYNTHVLAGNRLEALEYLNAVSTELCDRTRGRLCALDEVSDLPERPDSSGLFVIRVKWAIPLDHFLNTDEDTGDDIATWLIERVPPERPELMEASKGVFAEISLSEMRNEMHDKLRRARELDTFPPR